MSASPGGEKGVPEQQKVHDALAGVTLVYHSHLPAIAAGTPGTCETGADKPVPVAIEAVRVAAAPPIGSGSFSYVYLAHAAGTNERDRQLDASQSDSSSPSESATSDTFIDANDASKSISKLTSRLADPPNTPPVQAKRAVKRLFKDGLSDKQLELQRHEVAIIREIGPHKNIVPLRGIVEDEKSLFLVMDYCDSDLYDAITNRSGFSDKQVKHIFNQIVDAVLHCHSKGVYHRDLKPENCLIVDSSVNPEDYVIQLTDFGLATTDRWSTEMGCGSVRYMPPECFDPAYIPPNANSNTRGNKTPPPAQTITNPYSKPIGYPPASADVWSLAVLLLNLLFAKNPWHEAHPSDPIFATFVSTNPNILRQQFRLSPECDALLRRCFDLDPRRRCSVEDMKALVNGMVKFTFSNEEEGWSSGLIVPLGPGGREMAVFGVDRKARDAANQREKKENSEERMRRLNQKHRLDAVVIAGSRGGVSGLILAPGEEVGSHHRRMLVEQLAPDTLDPSTFTSPTSLSPLSFAESPSASIVNLPTSAATSASATTTGAPTTPKLAVQSRPSLKNSTDLSTDLQPVSSASEHVSVDPQLQQPQRPSSFSSPAIFKFPSLRRRLSNSIRGIGRTVKAMFPSFTNNHHDSGDQHGQEKGSDGFEREGEKKESKLSTVDDLFFMVAGGGKKVAKVVRRASLGGDGRGVGIVGVGGHDQEWWRRRKNADAEEGVVEWRNLQHQQSNLQRHQIWTPTSDGAVGSQSGHSAEKLDGEGRTAMDGATPPVTPPRGVLLKAASFESLYNKTDTPLSPQQRDLRTTMISRKIAGVPGGGHIGVARFSGSKASNWKALTDSSKANS